MTTGSNHPEEARDPLRSTTGPVRITHAVDGRTVVLVLTPCASGGDCLVSLDLEETDGLSAAFYLDGTLVERIADLGRRSHFETPLPAGGEGGIVVSRGGAAVLCTLSFRAER
jgi:hypothetical protein